MNASALNERTLALGDEIVHEGRESQCQDLGDDLCYGMDETYRPVVADVFSALPLWNEDYIGFV